MFQRKNRPFLRWKGTARMKDIEQQQRRQAVCAQIHGNTHNNGICLEVQNEYAEHRRGDNARNDSEKQPHPCALKQIASPCGKNALMIT